MLNKIFVLSILLFNFSLYADWSEPVVLSATGNSISNPKIATDPNGNAVAVWSENTAIRASTKLVNDTNWSDPVDISSTVSDSSIVQIGIDATGTATVIWEDSASIYTSRALLGQAWSSPFLLNTGGRAASLAVNASGNAVVVWQQGEPGTSIRGNYSIAGVWGSEEIVAFELGVNYFGPTVGIAANGDAVASWLFSSGGDVTIQVATRTLTWGPITSFMTLDNTSPPKIVVNAEGNAILAWRTRNISDLYLIEGRTYLNGSWLEFSRNLTTPFVSNNSLTLTLNDNGEGVIGWDQDDNVSSVFISIDGTVSPDNFTFLQALNPIVRINNNSQVVFGYTSNENSSVTARVTLWNEEWGNPTTISGSSANLSDGALTPQGNAFLIWVRFEGISIFKVEVSEGTNLFATGPNPPASISGRQVTNRFLTQADIINEISWTASPSLDVTSYNVYRGNKRIAIIAATSPLIYEDHNRRAYVSITYSVTAVNSLGESEPIFITVP